MTRRITLMAGCAILAMSATGAYADCAADLAAFEGGQAQTAGAEGGVSKDGSLAPLQTEGAGEDATAPMTAGGGTTTSAGGETTTAAEGATAGTDMASDGGAGAAGADAAGTQQEGQGIAKDGSVAPLESANEAGQGEATAGGEAVAMSQQDAQAQQQGGATAQDHAAGDAGAHGSGGGHSAGQMEALDRARAAMAAGDEAGCAAALEEARSM